VPFIGIRVYFYNRALLTQTGTRKPPASWRDANWNWDAFLDLARRVTVRQGTTATRWGTEVSTARRDWQPWVWNNGGDLFSADGTKLLVADPPSVEAIQYLADLIHKHRVAPTADELREQGDFQALFQASNMLMYHRPINQVAANRRGASFDWSVTAAPRGKAKQAWSSGGGVGWFIPTESKVKDETWELAKVMASKEGVRMEAVRGEAPPSRRSVANEPEFINPAEPPGADMKVVAEALEAMHVEAALIQGVEADTVLTEELAPVWRGQKTAREALQQAATRLTPLLNPPG
jgi:multiple sugar transport system substrate-binding protein